MNWTDTTARCPKCGWQDVVVLRQQAVFTRTPETALAAQPDQPTTMETRYRCSACQTTFIIIESPRSE